MTCGFELVHLKSNITGAEQVASGYDCLSKWVSDVI